MLIKSPADLNTSTDLCPWYYLTSQQLAGLPLPTELTSWRQDTNGTIVIIPHQDLNRRNVVGENKFPSTQ